MIYKKEVNFNAPIERVWQLLVNPDFTEQYMFGCRLLSDWEIGGTVNWDATTPEGKIITYVKGKVLEFEAGKMLKITMFDPNVGLADIPENYAKLSYRLEKVTGGTLTTIIQDFTGVENAEKRYNETAQGWEMIIPKMKELVEK